MYHVMPIWGKMIDHKLKAYEEREQQMHTFWQEWSFQLYDEETISNGAKRNDGVTNIGYSYFTYNWAKTQ